MSGQVVTVDVSMQLGSTTTVVDVQAGAGADLETVNSTVGSTISGQSIVLLPNLGRDASSLDVLQVGVTPTGQVAGTAADQGTHQLDEVNNTGDIDGTMTGFTVSYASNGAPTGIMPTPVESIEEFKVATTNQTADFNSAAGFQVQMVTKPGRINGMGRFMNFTMRAMSAPLTLGRTIIRPRAACLTLPYL